MSAADLDGEVVSTQEECPDCSTKERSFDELAKGLATGTISRRRALHMLGATLVGGALASIPAAAWAACKPLGRKCTANTQCCSRNCIKNPQGRGRICGCPTGRTLCNNQCLTCTAPKVLNTTTCSCQCPPNQACTSSGGTVNASSCECQCPGGKTLCGGQCVEVCSPPKVLNTSCQCQCPVNETCTSSGGTVNPSTCECECPGGKVLCNGACVTTCEPPQFLNANCQCECPTDAGCTSTGGTVNPTTCECECPGGKTVCGGQCVEVCAPPKVVLDPETCNCECPPDEACTSTGGTVNPNTCQCQCPGGKTLCQGRCVTSCDPTTGEVLNPASCQCECPGGETLCQGQCVPSCGFGRVLNPDTCQCDCAPGFTQCGNNCISCCFPRVLNPTTCACDCSPNACTPPLVANSNCFCECPANLCTAPMVPNRNNNCACECPLLAPNSSNSFCPFGQVPNPNNNCACEDCPSGTTSCGNTCCPPGSRCGNNAYGGGPRCCPDGCYAAGQPGGGGVCANTSSFSCANPLCTTNAECAPGQVCVNTGCEQPCGPRCIDAC